MVDGLHLVYSVTIVLLQMRWLEFCLKLHTSSILRSGGSRPYAWRGTRCGLLRTYSDFPAPGPIMLNQAVGQGPGHPGWRFTARVYSATTVLLQMRWLGFFLIWHTISIGAKHFSLRERFRQSRGSQQIWSPHPGFTSFSNCLGAQF